MMIGQELQIGHDPSQHIAYLESWVRAIKENPKEIFQAVRDADAIQDYILSLDPQRTKEIDESRQDQSVIKLLEENHDSIKAEHQDLTTPLETYLNIEKFINSFEAIKYNVVANEVDGGFSLSYFEAGRKTEITTDIGGMDGKALTSYKGERIKGSYYTSDNLQQQTDLITALGNDIAEQKQLVQEAREQIENLKIFLNVPFNEKGS
jgi:flagellar biosynthesis chaperone FliJ